jgi:hypothetical protein
MDFSLCGAILDLKAFCFGGIPDIMIESCVRHTGDNSALCDHGRAYLDKENK